MENWAEEIIKIIDSKLEGTREKDIRFFRIDEFKRNLTRIDTFSKRCSSCHNEQKNISEISDKIDEAVNVPGKSRREYDRIISKISKHIRKEHGYYTPYFFSYNYSFWGIIIGFIIGFLLLKIAPEYIFEMISIGFISGLIPAYILGSVKDKKIRSEKRLM